MRHYDRHRTINEAATIRWNGLEDKYSADLWVSLLDAQRRAEKGEQPVAVWFAGERHMLTLTAIEDILELIRKSFDGMNEAKTPTVRA